MSKESTGKVKADGERLFVGQFVILDDCPLYLSLVDAEHSHSVDGRTDLCRIAAVTVHKLVTFRITAHINKSAQSNLGRGPRRGAVAHVRRKVPIGYNGAPQIRPKSTPSHGPIPNLTTCLIPGPV